MDKAQLRAAIESAMVIGRRWNSATLYGEPNEDANGNPRSGWVYVIKFEDRIKIGYSKDPIRRIADIAAYFAGIPCEVLWIMPGTLGEERDCQEVFEKFRISGEWFKSADGGGGGPEVAWETIVGWAAFMRQQAAAVSP